MAKKPTANQLAARAKFIKAVKSGAFKKRKKKATKKAAKKSKTSKSALQTELKTKGVRLPHGYQLVKRKPRKRKK